MASLSLVFWVTRLQAQRYEYHLLLDSITRVVLRAIGQGADSRRFG